MKMDLSERGFGEPRMDSAGSEHRPVVDSFEDDKKTLGLHDILGMSGATGILLTSQERLCSI
jgi:hypothetical protein